MSQENVELIQRGLARFMTTGEPQWEMFDEAVEIYDHDTPDQGVYRGHAGVAQGLTLLGGQARERAPESDPQLAKAGSFLDQKEIVVSHGRHLYAQSLDRPALHARAAQVARQLTPGHREEPSSLLLAREVSEPAP